LAQAKDAVFLQGTSSISKYSISSMPDEIFVQWVQKMGVSLGVDENQVAASIHNMKKIDHNRTLIVLSKNVEDKNKKVTDNQTEIINHALNLSSDLCNEDKQNDEMAPLIQERKITRVYKRKEKIATKVVRRSMRLNKKI
jgi:hypothetical protein